MMRGGVARMRWRARARSGVTESGGGFAFSADMVGRRERRCELHSDTGLGISRRPSPISSCNPPATALCGLGLWVFNILK